MPGTSVVVGEVVVAGVVVVVEVVVEVVDGVVVGAGVVSEAAVEQAATTRQRRRDRRSTSPYFTRRWDVSRLVADGRDLFRRPLLRTRAPWSWFVGDTPRRC